MSASKRSCVTLAAATAALAAALGFASPAEAAGGYGWPHHGYVRHRGYGHYARGYGFRGPGYVYPYYRPAHYGYGYSYPYRVGPTWYGGYSAPGYIGYPHYVLAPGVIVPALSVYEPWVWSTAP